MLVNLRKAVRVSKNIALGLINDVRRLCVGYILLRAQSSKNKIFQKMDKK